MSQLGRKALSITDDERGDILTLTAEPEREAVSQWRCSTEFIDKGQNLSTSCCFAIVRGFRPGHRPNLGCHRTSTAEMMAIFGLP
jgi:hypothetical protein